MQFYAQNRNLYYQELNETQAQLSRASLQYTQATDW